MPGPLQSALPSREPVRWSGPALAACRRSGVARVHLALVTPEWYRDEPVGGIATYCRILAMHAIRLGYRVTVLAATNAAAKRAESAVASLRVVPIDVGGAGAVAVAERFARTWRELLARGNRPDVVEAAEYCGIAALLGTVAGAPPLVTRLHTPLALLLERHCGGHIYPDDHDRCALEREQVRASQRVTSPTRWLAGEATRLWALSDMPVVVPNPAEVRPLRRTKQPARTSRLAKVLFAGRIEHRKGVFVLAQALR